MSSLCILRTGRFAPALAFGFLICLAPFSAANAASAEDLHAICRQVHNDDTIREYSHDLYQDTVEAFRTLAPDAKGVPDDSDFQTQAQYRCMNDKVMVCLVGANLPCVKMNANRDNPGAGEFCRQNPHDDGVPAAATGHDAVYSYRCRNGKAEITGSPWELDERGFARTLWAELPDR